jgi:hypothetical protein
MGEVWRFEDVCGMQCIVSYAAEACLTIRIAGSSQALGRTDNLPHCIAHPGLYGFLQDAFPYPQPHGPWRCSDELSIPG